MRIRYFRIGRLMACMPLVASLFIGASNVTAQPKSDLPPPSQKAVAAAPGSIYTLEQLIQLEQGHLQVQWAIFMLHTLLLLIY